MFKIKKYNLIDMLFSIIIACIATLILLWCMLWKEINTVKEKAYVFPEFEFINIETKVPVEDIILEMEPEIEEVIIVPLVSDAVPIEAKSILNAYDGVAYGPSGKETYYNLPMDRVIQTMRDRGYTEADYPYMVREDGVKCLGEYVIVAASLERYHRGQIIETSLGQGIVCDTGLAVTENPEMIDIAVEW